jgi:SAM-dependent methyltransferase
MSAPASSESRDAAIERLRPFQERAHNFEGWSFDDLGIRRLGPPLPWSYEDLVRASARGTSAVLDLGTGGGERLAALRDALPRIVVATEEWSVNAPVARDRLVPLGVAVVSATSRALPFTSRSFDLVIDRHEAFEPSEVYRLLRPGGTFVTQQVGAGDWSELGAHFPRRSDFSAEHARYAPELRRLGCNVRVREHRERVAYPSLGEFVYMLAVAPWTIPDFDVERDIDALLALEQDCLTDEGLEVTEHRYLLTARKPAY